jgi:glycosyltransferase involved in cell wall biosynthesis
MDPLVSIITPTFNHARYLAQCITSVLEQTYTRWEMLIIDDASTDGTAAVARSFVEANPRIELIVHATRQGAERLVDTYNGALDRSRGEFIAVLEGDDWWTRDKLARQIPLLVEDASLALCYGDCWETTEDGRPIVYGASPVSGRSVRSSFREAMTYFSRLTSVPANTVLIRRDALERAGGFQSYPGLPLVDYPTWLALSLHGDFVRIPQPLGHWRRHTGSVYGQKYEQVARGCHSFFLEFVRRQRGAILDADLEPETLERKADRALARIRGSLRYFEGRYELISGNRSRARRKLGRAILDPHTMLRYRLAALVGFGAALSSPRLFASALAFRRITREGAPGSRCALHLEEGRP